MSAKSLTAPAFLVQQNDCPLWYTAPAKPERLAVPVLCTTEGSHFAKPERLALSEKVADNAVPKTKQFNEEQLKPGAEKAGEGLKTGADKASQGLQNAADQVSQQAGMLSVVLPCCFAAHE